MAPLIILFALALAGAATPLAQANTGKHRFDIPAQPLGAALQTLADQAGVQMFYAEDSAAGKATPALRGEYTTREAVNRLLAGTGLTATLTEDGTVTVAEAEREPETEPEPEVVILPEITVTGSLLDDTSYNVYSATTATKTDTPIMETPVSIQVVPRAVLDDQKTANIDEALENVSSVRPESSLEVQKGFIIRGLPGNFVQYRNGLRVPGTTSSDTANLQSLEVLKGPAAVLYGRIEPGGLINLVTKLPLATPYYSLEQQFGSYDFYRTLWDATGPITQDGKWLYRFTGAYQDSDSFRDFHFTERYQIYPSITWRPTDATEITVDVEGYNEDFQENRGLVAIGDRPAPVPISRTFDDPNDPTDNISNVYVGFNLAHRFNQSWTLRNRFLARYQDFNWFSAIRFGNLLPDNRTLNRRLSEQFADTETYATNLDLTGKLQILDTDHEVLVGFDYYRRSTVYSFRSDIDDPAFAIDIFNPTTRIDPARFRRDQLLFAQFQRPEEDWYGVYFQDQITLWDRLHILGGGRYDWASIGVGRSPNSFAEADALRQQRRDQKFSPRVGILYQPWPWLGVYGNWAQSFGRNNGISATGEAFPPQAGEQYEAGIKTQLFDERLTATLAYYHLTKSNLLTPDLSTLDEFDSIAIGEARSQGIEFDVSGQVNDYLSLIGSYAFTDVEVTKDNSGLQGKRLANVSDHAGSLWLKYDVNGTLADQGWSFGLGVFAVGQRDGDNENTFKLPGYARLDALAAYRFKLGPTRVTAQLNVRNLLDKEYFESAEHSFSNSSPRLAIYAGEPLTVLGSIRLQY